MTVRANDLYGALRLARLQCVCTPNANAISNSKCQWIHENKVTQNRHVKGHVARSRNYNVKCVGIYSSKHMDVCKEREQVLTYIHTYLHTLPQRWARFGSATWTPLGQGWPSLIMIKWLNKNDGRGTFRMTTLPHTSGLLPTVQTAHTESASDLNSGDGWTGGRCRQKRLGLLAAS